MSALKFILILKYHGHILLSTNYRMHSSISSCIFLLWTVQQYHLEVLIYENATDSGTTGSLMKLEKKNVNIQYRNVKKVDENRGYLLITKTLSLIIQNTGGACGRCYHEAVTRNVGDWCLIRVELGFVLKSFRYWLVFPKFLIHDQ